MKQLFFCCWCVLSGRFNNNNNIKHLSRLIFIYYFSVSIQRIMLLLIIWGFRLKHQRKRKWKRKKLCLFKEFVYRGNPCLFIWDFFNRRLFLCYYELRMSNTVSRLFFMKICHKKLCKWIENLSNNIEKIRCSIRFIVRLIVIWSCTR